ncbi:MAG: O-antigen ligase family protein [Sulfurisoma sp.]|nr:O-antigen ligase family protein [Sulfurisoma sp.]
MPNQEIRPSLWRGSHEQAGYFLWLGLLFLQPFNRYGAIKLLLLLGLIGVLVFGRWTHMRWTHEHLAAPTKVGILLLVWAVAVSLFGPYPLDSIDALRKEMLIQIVLFAAALRFVKNSENAWAALTSITFGYVLVTFASFGWLGNYWLDNREVPHLPGRSHDALWGGYPATAGICLPLLLGWLIWRPQHPIVRVAGWLSVLAAFGLIIMYGSRTPLLVVALSIFLLLIAKRLWKLVAVLLILVVVVGVSLETTAFGPQTARYASLFQTKTYVKNERNMLWAAVWDVSQDRLLTGYGYGWKKLAWAIRDGGYVSRWEQEKNNLLKLFPPEVLQSYGKANPHNYFLQVVFEIGLVGFGLVLIFWSLVAHQGLVILRQTRSDTRSFALVALIGLSAYAFSNITNGHWVGMLANISVTLAGCLVALRNSGTSNA